MSEDAKAVTRTPLGHPEGYLEAFASIYKMVATDIRRVKAGEAPTGGYPTVRDGLRGIQFVVSTVESSKKGAAWVDMPRG
jgi:hypothetical protein